jgi:predicted ATPase
MVPLTTASVLGVRETPDRPMLATLTDHLRTRQLLLVFDNFEHLLPASPLVSQLLADASGVRVLVTSRILLHVYGEREFAVPPLPVPPEHAGLAELAANPAVALFVDRAAGVSPGFHLTSDNSETIAEICRRVDGLPLAIELAAARTRILSANELATRLTSRLTALVGGSPDLADRQRTLRATIEWSHELLSPAEGQLFARIAVFDGGWNLEGAEAVAADGLDADLADALGSVVDQSLIQREPMDPPRFSMLETIREFATEQLEASGERDAVAARHAAYFRDLAEAAESHLTGEDAAAWSDRLALENDNLRAALRWSLATGLAGIAAADRIELGLRLAAAVWRYWQRVGALSEAREWLEALLARAAGTPPSRWHAKAILAAGGVVYWQADYDATARFYDEATQVAEAVGDRHLMAEALDAAAYVPMVRGDVDRSRELAAQAQAAWLAIGEPFRAGIAAANAAYLGFYQGRSAEAIPVLLAMVEEARRAGERYWLINGLTGLGQLYRDIRSVTDARRYFAEALQLALADGNLAMLTMALEPLANFEGEAGEHERSVRYWAVSDAIKERIGGGAPPEEMRVHDPREEATAAIGADAVTKAEREGRAMTAAEAVREAVAVAGLDDDADKAAEN